MSSKKKKQLFSILFLVLLCEGLGAFYWHKTKFIRTYKHGTTYEQLNILLNTTQYSKNIEASGYEVDQYYLKMNSRALPLDIGNNVILDYIDPDVGKIKVGKGNENINGTYDCKMKYSYGFNGNNKSLTKLQVDDYDKQIKAQINVFLDTVYNDMTK